MLSVVGIDRKPAEGQANERQHQSHPLLLSAFLVFGERNLAAKEPAQPVGVPASLETSERLYTDDQLRERWEEAWRASWERFYDERTHLFYDYVCSYDPKNRLAALPTPEEIRRQFPNRNGWGTGMYSAISGEPCSR